MSVWKKSYSSLAVLRLFCQDFCWHCRHPSIYVDLLGQLCAAKEQRQAFFSLPPIVSKEAGGEHCLFDFEIWLSISRLKASPLDAAQAEPEFPLLASCQIIRTAEP